VSWVNWSVNYRSPLGIAVNRRTGDVAMSTSYYAAAAHSRDIRIYDKNRVFLYNKGGAQAGANVNFEFDKFGGIWNYDDYYKDLTHLDNELDDILYELCDGTDFLYDLAVEMDGDGVWYTNKIDNMLIHKNFEGSTLNTIALNEPKAICGTLDNGCWVVDNTDEKAYRYNFGGTLIKTANIGRTATRMCTDMVDGFWYISANYVYHVNSNGVEDVSVNIPQPTKVSGGYNGAAVYSQDNDFVKYIDNSGNIVRTFIDPSGTGNTGYPALFSFRYDNFVEFQNTDNLIPVSYDPVWNGSLEWKQVKKDGYFLPKTQYHQAEITLRCEGSTSPILNKLIIPAAIKVEDIQPQTSKNVYVKTVVPDGASIQSYETKIRAWWGCND